MAIDQHALMQMLDNCGVDGTCPRCKNANGWELAEEFIALLHAAGGTQLDLQNPKAQTVIALACNNCGFMALHDARKLGFR
jgi:predicted nucleic-acid-binding Zn-ribbon protein